MLDAYLSVFDEKISSLKILIDAMCKLIETRLYSASRVRYLHHELNTAHTA